MKKAVLFSLFLSFILISNGQDAKYKALFIYNFTKQIEWPTSEKSGDFVIGVVNNNELYDQLVSITTGKKAGTQNIIVKKMKGIEEVESCHILFLASYVSSGSNMETVLGKLNDKPTLIVTERSGSIQKGSCINFVIQDDKIKFELNKQAAVKRGLQVSSYLENLAIVVN
jgi:hypothetical protein